MRGDGGVDVGVEDGSELLCSNGGYDIVAGVEGRGLSGGKEALHDVMEELAFFRGADAPLGFVERLGAEANGGEGLKGTGGLVLEDMGAAGVSFVRPGQDAGVFGDFFEVGLCGCGPRRGCGLRLSFCGKEAGDEGRGAELGVFIALGVAEDDLGCGVEQSRGDFVGEVPVVLRSGVGHLEFALRGGGKQRMEAAARGPCGVVGVHEPNGVELLAGGCERAHDLDGGVLGFGGEDGFKCVALEDFQKVGVAGQRAVEVEEGDIVEEALPTLQGLELQGVGGTLAGPGDAVEEKLHELGPRGGLAIGSGDLMGFDGACVLVDVILEGAEGGEFEERLAEGGERALGRKQAVAALAAVVIGEGEVICNGVCDES